MDLNGLSDPYVSVQFHPDRNGLTKKRTKTIQKDLNPTFNETITLYVTRIVRLQQQIYFYPPLAK